MITVLPTEVRFTEVFGPISEVIDKVYYNSDTEELWVVTHNGGPYGYRDVPKWSYEDFANAGSAGAHWNYHIKSCYSPLRVEGKYKFVQKEKPVVAVPGLKLASSNTSEFVVVAEVTGTVSVTINATNIEDAISQLKERVNNVGNLEVKVKEVTQRFGN